MLLKLVRSYLTWLLISATVCLIGTIISVIVVPSQGREFLVSYVYHWNGLIVVPTGVGALQFGISTFKAQFHYLVSEILEVEPNASGPIYLDLERLFSWKNKQIIAVPVFLIGALTLYICGYPLTGLPRFILWLASSLMFYVGGMMLAYTIYLIRLFSTIEQNLGHVRLRNNVHILELDSFNLYLSTLFFAGAVALYFAFRGTLTANFTFVPPFGWADDLVRIFISTDGDYKQVRNLLIYPIVIFVPYGIIAGFYIRIVLRKIYLASIKQKICEIDDLASPFIDGTNAKNTGDRAIEIRNAVMDLKGKIMSDSKDLSLVNIKDSPSIVLLVIIAIQFVMHNDGTIKGFMSNFLVIN
ncbi:MAG: hypothetical protein JWR80_9944 [Bradyrhizobium sp.]|nr:hypothetical protein [Bradyrhizobium sp.]